MSATSAAGVVGGVDAATAAGAAVGVSELKLRGCLRRQPTSRERLAQHLWDRLHPVMAALGLLFLVLVLAQAPAREGTTLQRALLAATWFLWVVFVGEYVLRLVVAPSTRNYLRRTWWQIFLLAVPILMTARALLALRVARPTRVALAARRSVGARELDGASGLARRRDGDRRVRGRRSAR